MRDLRLSTGLFVGILLVGLIMGMWWLFWRRDGPQSLRNSVMYGWGTGDVYRIALNPEKDGTLEPLIGSAPSGNSAVQSATHSVSCPCWLPVMRSLAALKPPDVLVTLNVDSLEYKQFPLTFQHEEKLQSWGVRASLDCDNQVDVIFDIPSSPGQHDAVLPVKLDLDHIEEGKISTGRCPYGRSECFGVTVFERGSTSYQLVWNDGQSIDLHHVWSPAISRDGRYLAYMEETEGSLWYSYRLYLLDFSDRTSKSLCSSFGGSPVSVIFSSDCKYLIYQCHGLFPLLRPVRTWVYSCDLDTLQHTLLGSYTYDRPYKNYLDLILIE